MLLPGEISGSEENTAGEVSRSHSSLRERAIIELWRTHRRNEGQNGHRNVIRQERTDRRKARVLRPGVTSVEKGCTKNNKMELLNNILRKENLKAAYENVVRNNGSAGVDGLSINDLKPYLQKHWTNLKAELESGRYQPSAILGISIPKRSGGERLLGIPTTVDRMIQQEIHQELSPLFDPGFSEYSYGFRPGKSAGQAIAQVLDYINQGFNSIVDIDLKSFFDEVNHDYLMQLVKSKVKDPEVLRLIGDTCAARYRLTVNCTKEGKAYHKETR
jgi:retron-type reverse transcriptase